MTLSQIERLANELIDKKFSINPHGYGDNIVMSARVLGYSFEWSNRKRAAGVCSYNRLKIMLSMPIMKLNLNDVDFIRDTILHEIAHAFTKGHHHDRVWVRVAKQIGCNGKRCYNGDIHLKGMQSKYTISCPTCHNKRPLHRMKKRVSSCGRCSGGTYNPQHKLVITQNY